MSTPLGARRTFRLGLVTALALALAYGLGMQFPYFAPLFAFLLTSPAAPPPGLKGLFGLLLVVTITLGVGLVLTPLLGKYPVSAVLIIAAGLYLSTVISLGLGKAFVGTLLTVGFTMIPAAGQASYALASSLVHGLLLGIAGTVVCQWIVYPFFPEDPRQRTVARPPTRPTSQTRWLALRSTMIVLPPVLLAFSNPALYLPTIMKSVLLGQQGSALSVRSAGRELLGSMFLAGVLAILFWFALKLCANLWMFFLWMLLVGLWISSRMYGVFRSRFSPSFWLNVVVNLLILLGPAVEDSAAGKDVYRAFAVRFALFVAVTLYAWTAILALEWMRARGRRDAPEAELAIADG